MGARKNQVGRKPGFAHHQHTRNKIKTKALINRLTEHAMADEPIMDASQVNAAKALLSKTLPDLQAVEHKNEDGTAVVALNLSYQPAEPEPPMLDVTPNGNGKAVNGH